MSKNQTKKHRFVHLDPEKTPTVIKEKSTKKGRRTKTKVPSQEFSGIFTDLKGTVITIAVFVALLVAFYFTDINFNILEKIKELFF